MTEKDYNPNQKTREKGNAKNVVQKQEKKENKVKTGKAEDKVDNVKKEDSKENTAQEKKEEKKKPIVKKEIVKKDYAVVNVKNVGMSTKHAIAICKFIKFKTISQAVQDLQEVLNKKKAIPMKGEIPHRKGKMMSGRYAEKATKNFMKIVRSLGANAVANEMEEPVIVKAVANLAYRPYTRFGRGRKKRTHVTLEAKEKKGNKKSKEKKK